MTESKSLVHVLLAWRRFIFATTALAAAVSIVVSLLLPSWYAATATVLPEDESGEGGGLLQLVSQLGGGGGAGRVARNLLSRTPTSDLMIGVLKSRRLRGEIVDRFDLVEVYDVKSREHAIRELGKHIEVATTPEGMVSIRVEDRDRERAAELANGFLESLDAFNREVSVENARRTRDFIEQRLEESRERLEEAASRLRAFQENQGAIHLSDQIRVTVEAIAALQAERLRLDIERGVLETYSSPDLPKTREIAVEIQEIDRSLDLLLGRAGPSAPPTTDPPEEGEAPPADTGVFLPLGSLPSIGLEYADLKREVLVQETVFEYLTSQFEEARIRVAQDQQTIIVLDEAVPPLRRARPRRSLIVILTCLAAVLGTAGFALASESILETWDGGRDRPGASSLVPELQHAVHFLRGLRSWGTPHPEAISEER